MKLLLAMIPGWAKVAILLALAAAALALFAVWKDSIREEGRDEIRAEWSLERDRQYAQAVHQAAKNAAETERRLRAQQEIQDVHDKELLAYKRSAADAAAALGGLRKRVADLSAVARRGTSDTATVADRAAAGAATGMLADLSGRTDEAAEVYARFADASRRAGLQCQREHESLTQGATP